MRWLRRRNNGDETGERVGLTDYGDAVFFGAAVAVFSVPAMLWWRSRGPRKNVPVGKRLCEDCKWCSESGSTFAHCLHRHADQNKDDDIEERDALVTRTVPPRKASPLYCTTARLGHLCGPKGKWFEPKENDDGGHRTTAQAASGGAGQATYPSPGAAAAGTGAAASASGAGGGGGSGGIVLYYPYIPAQIQVPPKIEDAGITVGEFIAWRAWKVKYGFLTSAYVQEVWAPDAPMEGDVGKGYGVHAWKSPHAGSNLADEEALLTELRERYKIEKES